MKSSMVFTNTLSPHLFDWVKSRAKKMKTTQRMVLENALQWYRLEVERKEWQKGFLKAAKDPEMKAMVEEGLADYLEQLNKLDL